MKSYVAGFMFRTNPDACGRDVALILKDHPDFQKGKHNGIGGKIQPGEKPIVAMIREFHEEAGPLTIESDWRLYCRLFGPDWEVFFYTCVDGDGWHLRSMEREPVAWVPLNRLKLIEIMPNLQWLIPLALDKDRVFAEVRDDSIFEVPA